MKKTAIGFMLAAALLAPGCGSKAGNDKATPQQLQPLNAKEEAPPPPPDPTVPAPSAADAPAKADDETMLVSLNSMVSDFSMSRNRMPNGIEELVALKLLPAMPEAPEGKKFVIDPKLRRVVLAPK